MNIAGQIAGQDHSNTSYFVRQPASFEGQPGAKHYAGSKQAQPELGDFSGHSLCSRGVIIPPVMIAFILKWFCHMPWPELWSGQ